MLSNPFRKNAKLVETSNPSKLPKDVIETIYDVSDVDCSIVYRGENGVENALLHIVADNTDRFVSEEIWTDYSYPIISNGAENLEKLLTSSKDKGYMKYDDTYIPWFHIIKVQIAKTYNKQFVLRWLKIRFSFG